MEQDQTAFEVTDGRRRGWFHLDNALIDAYARRIGIGGLALYMTLARHANGSATAYPSLRRLQALLNISRTTILKYLDVLEKEHLISRQTRQSLAGDPTSTLYTLLPLPHEGGGSKFEPPGSEFEPPGSEFGPGVVQNLDHGGSNSGPEGRPILRTTQGKEEDSSISIVSFPSPAEQVLDHLCAVTGRRYRSLGEIPGCLTRGVTVEQCTLVIDWWKDVKTVEHQEQEQYFDHTTPFRAKNFDKYLAQAEVWHAQGRPPPLRTRLSEPAQRTAQASLRLLEEYNRGADRHAGVPRRAQ